MHYIKTLIFLGSLLGFGFAFWRYLLASDKSSWIDYRFVAIIPLIAVGLYAPNLWVYYAAVFLTITVLPRSRIEAVGLYIFLAIMLPLVSHDVLLGSTYLLRLEGRMVASLGLLAALRFPAPRSSFDHTARNLAIFAYVFVALQIFIDARTENTNVTNIIRNITSATLSLGIPFFVFSRSVGRDTDIRLPVFYLAAAGFMLSIVATFEMFRHWPLYQSIESHLGTSTGLSKTLALRGGLLRAPGPYLESTTFGFLLAVSTICAAALRSIFRSPAAHAAAVGIGCLGCFATLSRNAWIGVLLGMIVAGFYRGRIGKAAAAGILAAAVASVMFIAVPNSGLTAALLGKGDTSAANTATYRQDLVRKSLPLIKASPWIGTAYDRVRNIMQFDASSGKLKVDYVNSYLYFAVTSGVIGLSLFFCFMAYPPFALWRSRRSFDGNRPGSETATALFSAHIAIAFMAFGTSFFERIPLFAIFLIAMTRLVIVFGRGSRDVGTGLAQPSRPRALVIDPQSPRLLPAAAEG